MSTRHKQIPIIEQDFDVSTGANGIFLIPRQIDHGGKSNHFINVNFQVLQSNPNMAHDIRFYILNEQQLINWLLSLRFNNQFIDPPHYVYSSGKILQANHRMEISESIHLCFLFDNRYSTITSKTVKVSIYEEWDEPVNQLDVVTTIPPHDASLKQGVENLINSSTKDLKILTPYIDMSLISQLLTKHKAGVTIQVITRNRSEFSNKGAKEAFNHINKNLGKNHKTNEHIHSRLMISDGHKALVSSADLTQDSLLGQFNAGILVSESEIINKLLDYFKRTWDLSSISS